MLSIDEFRILVKLSRESVFGLNVSGTVLNVNSDFLKNKHGVFVTFLDYKTHDLKGCVGFPYPVYELSEAVCTVAKSAAFDDSRFEPLTQRDAGSVIIEISVLTVPELIDVNGLESLDYIKNICIGKDGLIVQNSIDSGLLLPQVATDNNMDALSFLENTCLKAGFKKDAYKDEDVSVFKFQAQVFSEVSPGGDLIEKL
ncbi:MAG: TIGR00296 family protein [DPANN group archaeon]|nr:TIGR00296 family protein [DPANN group archaeon]